LAPGAAGARRAGRRRARRRDPAGDRLRRRRELAMAGIRRRKAVRPDHAVWIRTVPRSRGREMRALTTGGGGLVATALARRIPAAVTLTHAQLDITNRPAVFAAVRELRPDLIINCAVVGVDACEADPTLAEAINVDGPALLADAAAALVHFSSNYVLDPVNVYGRTKLRGEAAVAERCPRA